MIADWRNSIGISQDALARLLGFGGRNPQRTWQRLETGQHQPTPKLIAQVEVVSRGQITAATWAAQREHYLANQAAEVEKVDKRTKAFRDRAKQAPARSA